VLMMPVLMVMVMMVLMMVIDGGNGDISWC
jgi:hypothetical protein